MVLAVAYNWDFGLVLSYTHLWAKGLGVTLAYSVGTVLGATVVVIVSVTGEPAAAAVSCAASQAP